MKTGIKLAAIAAMTCVAGVSHAAQYVITTNDVMTDSKVKLLKAAPSMTIIRQMTDQRRWVVDLPDRGLDVMLDKLRASDFIKAVEPDRWVTTQYVPNDPYISDQYSLMDENDEPAGINLWDALDYTTGAGSIVAVLDTGYVDHPDLDANRLPGYDMISSSSTAGDGNGRDSDATDVGDYAWYCFSFSSSWHGSHVAGTATGVGDNGTGITGIAYEGEFVPVRVLGKCGGTLSDIADGVRWAAGLNVSGTSSNPYPADVINLSLGGSGSCDSYMQDAINDAVAAGSVVVVAAGNSNANAANYTPASCNNIITVAAVDQTGGKASYSNYGNVVEIAAPGSSILSTIDSGRRTSTGPAYAYYSGTSMATPTVAGVVALMKAANPSLTPADVLSILQSTASPFPASCSGCGAGIVDAEAAVEAALAF